MNAIVFGDVNVLRGELKSTIGDLCELAEEADVDLPEDTRKEKWLGVIILSDSDCRGLKSLPLPITATLDQLGSYLRDQVPMPLIDKAKARWSKFREDAKEACPTINIDEGYLFWLTNKEED